MARGGRGTSMLDCIGLSCTMSHPRYICHPHTAWGYILMLGCCSYLVTASWQPAMASSSDPHHLTGPHGARGALQAGNCKDYHCGLIDTCNGQWHVPARALTGATTKKGGGGRLGPRLLALAIAGYHLAVAEWPLGSSAVNAPCSMPGTC